MYIYKTSLYTGLKGLSDKNNLYASFHIESKTKLTEDEVRKETYERLRYYPKTHYVEIEVLKEELEFYKEDLYDMKFSHAYAYGEMTLFRESIDGESTYWINASESLKDINEKTKVIAIMFTKDELSKFKSVLNKLDI